MLFAAVIVCLMGIMYQSNTSSSFYPGALDGVTAVVMIDIIAAIIYYFTMLFSEIAILYNEDSNRKRLERAAKGRGGAASPRKKAGEGASPRGAGSLVTDDGEIMTGRVDTSTNPLFLSQSQGGQGGQGASVGDDGSLHSSRTPPPAEMWPLAQAEFAALKEANRALQAQLGEARKAAGGGGGGGADEDASPRKVGAAGKKSAFGPTTASGGASSASKLLLKKKVSAKSSETF